MAFLPRTAETLQEIISLLIALPLSLIGTMFIIGILNSGLSVGA